MRFKANILAKLRNKLNNFEIGELTVTEIEECKTLWILHGQKFIIGKDNFTKVKNSLNLFYDDEKILHVKTRISGIESFSFDKKFPILLKKDSYFAEFPANIRLDEDVLKTSLVFVFRRRLQDVLIKTNIFALLIRFQKTSSR